MSSATNTVTLKTAELIGFILDWAVAKSAGHLDRAGIWPARVTLDSPGVLRDNATAPNDYTGECDRWAPSEDWSQGGPIIERESLWVRESAKASPAVAHLVTPDRKWFSYSTADHKGQAPGPYYGGTFLIAAMRCFIASKLGDEVSIPAELLPIAA